MTMHSEVDGRRQGAPLTLEIRAGVEEGAARNKVTLISSRFRETECLIVTILDEIVR